MGAQEDYTLLMEVTAELADPRTLDKTHGLVSTYNAGCRGPLCQKANRDYARTKYAKRAKLAGAVASPHVKLRTERDHDALLTLLQEQHARSRAAESAKSA